MKLPLSTVLLALVAVGVIAAFWLSRGNITHAEVTIPTYQKLPAQAEETLKTLPVGMSGCLAAACHGGPAEKTLAGDIGRWTWQSSGTCWAAVDPHTVAYSLLTDSPLRPVKVTAKQIMDRYAPGTRATEDTRCVACHTNPVLARPDLLNDPHAHQLRTEGVSCEACHGNAGAWVNEHTTWAGDRSAVYAKAGMVPLHDIGERAVSCTGCHVGAPADPERGLPVRDMNHDMIAAGHPRLNFDFAEYIRRLPRHWQEKDRVTNLPRQHNEVKVWLVGRVAHAESACRLLADRVERSKTDSRSPWPEFAEFNCAACHHELRSPAWRQNANYLDGRQPGATPWQTIWPLTPAAGVAFPTHADSPLRNVIQLAEKPRFPRTNIPATARKTSELLKHQRNELVGLTDVDVIRRVEKFFPPPDTRSPGVPEWDSAVQMYLGLAALERARIPNSKDARPEFRKAREALRTDQWPEFDWPALTSALDAIRKKP